MSNSSFSQDVISDVQRRLAALGHDPIGEISGVLGEPTRIALQAFQRQRGLAITGELDAVTFSRLEEAGWQLGNRLLFLTRPHLRGDDVAALQESLALLGFNSGRIDGIFGVLTKSALEEFQRNCAIDESGVLTRSTLDELLRLAHRDPGRRPVTETHDSARLVDKHHHLVIVHGHSPLSDLLGAELAANVDVLASETPNDVLAAAKANRLNAALLIAVSDNLQVEGCDLNFYESYKSHSTIGRQLSHAIGGRLRETGVPNVRVGGMSLPILRETAMPAISLSMGRSTGYSLSVVARIVTSETVRLFDRSR